MNFVSNIILILLICSSIGILFWLLSAYPYRTEGDEKNKSVKRNHSDYLDRIKQNCPTLLREKDFSFEVPFYNGTEYTLYPVTFNTPYSISNLLLDEEKTFKVNVGNPFTTDFIADMVNSERSDKYRFYNRVFKFYYKSSPVYTLLSVNNDLHLAFSVKSRRRKSYEIDFNNVGIKFVSGDGKVYEHAFPTIFIEFIWNISRSFGRYKYNYFPFGFPWNPVVKVRGFYNPLNIFDLIDVFYSGWYNNVQRSIVIRQPIHEVDKVAASEETISQIRNAVKDENNNALYRSPYEVAFHLIADNIHQLKFDSLSSDLFSGLNLLEYNSDFVGKVLSILQDKNLKVGEVSMYKLIRMSKRYYDKLKCLESTVGLSSVMIEDFIRDFKV